VGRTTLLNKYLGPFEILSRRGSAAYKLRLPASLSRMFNVFHVSLLERYKDRNRRPAPPVVVLDDGEIECKIDKILQDWSQVIQWGGGGGASGLNESKGL